MAVAPFLLSVAAAAVARPERLALERRARRLCMLASAQPSVLVVDDDALLRGAVCSYLAESGFAITQAASADDGLACARRERPQLLVLDVMMPGTSGIEMLERLRADAQLATTPVVLLTARGFTADRIRGYKAGCSAYITKPFDPEELVAILRALLEADGRYAARGAAGAAAARRTEGGGAPPSSLALGVLVAGEERGAAQAVEGFAEQLSEREREVLRLVCRGMMNKEIAAEVGLSSRMVEKYVSRLLSKSNTATRTQLTRLAVKGGLAE